MLPPQQNSSTIDAILINEIEKRGEWFSEKVEQNLNHMREAWHEGKRDEILQELQTLRQDRDRWSVLSVETKAKLLCFEGSIELYLTDNINLAQKFADQAHELTSTSNEARLRASIAFTQGKLEEAIANLTQWDDMDSLHLKAALYLELQNPAQCQQILDTITSNPTAETYRLRALSYLITKDINQAQLESQKALELKPHWQSIKFSAAIINYYSAISLPALDPLTISADPIDWVIIKRDDNSLAKLQQASAQFQELVKLPDQTPEDLRRYQTWALACLANDFTRQEEAIQHCQLLLDKDPLFLPAIAWIIARNYDLNLTTSKTALEERITHNTALLNQIIILIECYISEQKLDKALNLLTTKESMFQDHKASAAWLFTFSQIQILKETPKIALAKLNDYEPQAEIDTIQILVLAVIARNTGDWQALENFLAQTSPLTTDPNLLLNICKLKAEQQDWGYIVDHAETLLYHFDTADVLSLVVIATHNALYYSRCLQLLDKYRHLFPQSKLPPQLRRMRAICLQALGDWTEAAVEVKTLASEAPTVTNLLASIDICIITGNFKRLALIAHQLEAKADLPAKESVLNNLCICQRDRGMAR